VLKAGLGVLGAGVAARVDGNDELERLVDEATPQSPHLVFEVEAESLWLTNPQTPHVQPLLTSSSVEVPSIESCFPKNRVILGEDRMNPV